MGQRPRSNPRLVLCLTALLAVTFATSRPSASLIHRPNGPTTSAVAPVRILVFYDIEGASGITDGAMFDSRQPAAWAIGREHLIADVNAVVAGLFDGGATAVDVFNSHGAGGDTLVPRARLDPRARILTRRTPRVAYDPANGFGDSGYYAMAAIAMHDKPLSGGFSPHTMAMGISPVINGSTLTEPELLAYALGSAGVPLILASGDDVLGRTLARAMPWVEYVAVKRTNISVVEPLPATEVLPQLRAAATRAIHARQQTRRMPPLRLTAPIQAGVLPTFPAWLYPTMGDLPGLTRRGDTVTFSAPDYPTAYRGMQVLIDLASSAAEGVMVDFLRSMPEGQRLMRAAWDSVNAKWEALERGKRSRQQ